MPRQYIRGTVQERLDAWTDKSGDCWLWTGSVQTMGYGRITIGGRPQLVHRVAWVLEHGPIPNALFVLHRCDTPACVRVDHLFLGTQADNITDMMAKGRDGHGVLRGSQHPDAKLREEDIPVIRQMRRDGIPFKVIAAHFHVTISTISNVAYRRQWKHVPEHQYTPTSDSEAETSADIIDPMMSK